MTHDDVLLVGSFELSVLVKLDHIGVNLVGQLCTHKLSLLLLGFLPVNVHLLLRVDGLPDGIVLVLDSESVGVNNYCFPVVDIPHHDSSVGHVSHFLVSLTI